MPLYEYRCESCDKVFEAYRRLSEEGEEPCPSCGRASSRIGLSIFRAGGSTAGSQPGGSSCGTGSSRSPFR